MSETPSDTTRYAGRVKWFNNKAGYGFISTSVDGQDQDIFVHHSELQPSTNLFRYLVEGEYVEFGLSQTSSEDDKVSARAVKGLNGGKLMCETRNDRKQNQMARGEDNDEAPRRRPRRGGGGPRGEKILTDTNGQEWELVRRRGPSTTRRDTNEDSSQPSFS